MIHDGKLELSLNDMLKLVAENELDLEPGCYTYLIAQTTLTFSILNRAAQADNVRERIEYRQAEAGLDQTGVRSG